MEEDGATPTRPVPALPAMDSQGRLLVKFPSYAELKHASSSFPGKVLKLQPRYNKCTAQFGPEALWAAVVQLGGYHKVLVLQAITFGTNVICSNFFCIVGVKNEQQAHFVGTRS